MAVDEKVLDFVGSLRAAGVQVSIAESMDALEALKVVPLERIDVFRSALRATLVKKDSDFPLFDSVFEGFFSGAGVGAGQDAEGDEPEPPGPELTPPDLTGLLREALARGSADELAALAMAAAEGIGQAEGGFGPGRSPISYMIGPGYYTFRALEWLSLRELAAELEEMAASGELLPELPPVLALEEVRARIVRFRRELEREITRRVAAERGEVAAQRRKRPPQRPEEVDFVGATLQQVEEMKRILPALARRLAARLARKKSAGSRGRVDIRNTLRHSLSTGGVPLEVKYKKRVPSRPELFILCDVSGSVRTFSTFTLQLVYSLHQQFSAVRSFAFVDRVDEVTDFFESFEVGEAVKHVYRDADVVDGDGHSDVGRALDLFISVYRDDLSPRSAVLILSDARNNGKDPRAFALDKMLERTPRVYWLNPEPRERWDSGDSIIDVYTEHCHAVHECRNLKQLAEFVYRGT